MAVVSMRVLGGDHEMDQEARRLQAVLTQAREDAMLEGRDVGLRVDSSGYDFLRYDGRVDRWDLVADDPLLRERKAAGLGRAVARVARGAIARAQHANGASPARAPDRRDGIR
jgi:hypothetical protein